MDVGGVAERFADVVEVHAAVGTPGERLHRRAHHHGMVGSLVGDGVRALARDDLAAARHLRHERDQVAHGPARHEQPGLLAGELGGALFQCDGRRVVSEDVVPELGVGHGAAHLGCGVCDGVGAEVDLVGHREAG